jgi:SWIM zinc finger
MSATWTQEQILALAPDTNSAKNAIALAVQTKWLSLGFNEQAVWGEYQGSDTNLYQTQVDLTEPALNCTCPSRKQPCKHALGLFVLFASQRNVFNESTPPAWTNELLNTRDEKETKNTEPTKKVIDTAAQAKRAEMRYKKVAAGMQDFEVWLRDLMRQGLAVAQGHPYSFWDATAARLMDAQAPGMARLVREMGGIPYSGMGWQERLLMGLGRVYLLVEGFKRLEALPTDLQADIRTQIGWTQNQEELLTKQGVRDSWLILGQRVEEQDSLNTQRNWLWGKQTQQAALILNFAHVSQVLDTSLVPGTCIDAELVFFESAYSLRALVKTHHGEPTPVDTMPGYNSIKDMMEAYANALSRNPWIEQFPVTLQTVIPCQHDGKWFVGDGNGYQLSLIPNFQRLWQLLATSGGYPINIFGEWNGEYFLPLGLWAEGAFVSL